MRRNKLIFLLGAVLVLTISLGFLGLSDDDPTTAASYSTFRPVTPLQQADYLGSWSAGANITSPGSNGGAGVGYDRNDTCWLFALNGDENGSSLAPGTFRKYNVTTNTWTNLSTNTGRCWTSMTKAGPVSNTILYNLGGLPSLASAWTSMTGTLQSYSINTNTWTMLTAAPTPAGSSGFITYQDTVLYAVGGMGTTGQPITNVQVYNTVSGTWRAGTPLPAARANGWVAIMSDTIYYGCGAGPTTSTFNNTIYVGKISASDRSVITWTTAAYTYPESIHRVDAAPFGCKGAIIGPGGNAWWGMGTGCYTWMGGTSPFVSVGPVPSTTSDAMTGSVSFQRGSYKVWKFVIASGLILAAPYHILNTQIYTDSCMSSAPPSLTYPTNVCNYGTIPLYPSGVWAHGSEVLGDTLYIVGGGSAGSGSTTSQRYAINSNTFSPGTTLPETKASAPLVRAGNSLYLIGGGATVSTNGTTCWKYTPGAGWVSIAPLPTGLSGHGAVCWGDSVIFVMGGPYSAPATNIYYYRIATNTWGTSTSCLAARRTAAYGIVGNKLIIMAGYNAAFYKNVQIGTIGSNASTITWAAGPDVPGVKTGSSRPGGTGVGDRFYFVPGETTPAPYPVDSIFVFNVTTNAWLPDAYTGRGAAGTGSNYWDAVSSWVAPNGRVKIFIAGGALTAAFPGLWSLQVPACTITGVENNSQIPTVYSLSQNYPNPFNPVTKISFDIPKMGFVTLKIYDIVGKEIATLVNEVKNPGSYIVDFNGASLSSGVYFYRLESNGFVSTKKMMLIK